MENIGRPLKTVLPPDVWTFCHFYPAWRLFYICLHLVSHLPALQTEKTTDYCQSADSPARRWNHFDPNSISVSLTSAQTSSAVGSTVCTWLGRPAVVDGAGSCLFDIFTREGLMLRFSQPLANTHHLICCLPDCWGLGLFRLMSIYLRASSG